MNFVSWLKVRVDFVSLWWFGASKDLLTGEFSKETGRQVAFLWSFHSLKVSQNLRTHPTLRKIHNFRVFDETYLTLHELQLPADIKLPRDFSFPLMRLLDHFPPPPVTQLPESPSNTSETPRLLLLPFFNIFFWLKWRCAAVMGGLWKIIYYYFPTKQYCWAFLLFFSLHIFPAHSSRRWQPKLMAAGVEQYKNSTKHHGASTGLRLIFTWKVWRILNFSFFSLHFAPGIILFSGETYQLREREERRKHVTCQGTVWIFSFNDFSFMNFDNKNVF